MAASSSQFSCPSGVGGGVNGSYLEWHLSFVKYIDDLVTLFSCCGSPMHNGFKSFHKKPDLYLANMVASSGQFFALGV